MAEVESRTQSQPDQPAPPSTKPRQGPARKRKKKILKTILTLVIIAGILGAGGYALYRFLNSGEAEIGEIYSGTAEIGSITSSVSGNGSARSKESAAITLSAGGIVEEVFVTSGDIVFEGQPLYTINSQAALDAVETARNGVAAAQEEVEAAQKELERQNEELSRLRDRMGDLTITAPFSGKLMDIQQEYQTDDPVSAGTVIATLVNDRIMKLSLYFSYAYEDSIYVGQRASVTIPSVMSVLEARVEKINKVSYITPEGGTFFEVILTFENPDTLTADMAASAVLTDADGKDIYPYKGGSIEFYEQRTITAKASGPVIAVGNLLNYASVSAGEALLYLGTDDLDEEIRQQQLKIDEAQLKIEEAQKKVTEAEERVAEAEKNLDNFNAVAPINGTVISCTLTEGAEVKAGDTVIIISNNTTMLVDITVDDRNIAFVRPGSFVELSDWSGGVYMGEVTSIDMGGAQMGSGMTNYPVTLTVDNWSGSLMDGAWLQYSFVTSQSDDCVLVPSAAVRYFNDMEGNRQSVVFVQRDERPDNVPELDLPEVGPYETPSYPSEEEGYYPVIVETGLADTKSCEIISGVEAGDTVFISYTVKSSTWG